MEPYPPIYRNKDFTRCVMATDTNLEEEEELIRTTYGAHMFLKSIFKNVFDGEEVEPRMTPKNINNEKERIWLIPVPKEMYEAQWKEIRERDLIEEKEKITWVSTFHEPIAELFSKLGERVAALETGLPIQKVSEQMADFPPLRNMLIEEWNSNLFEQFRGYDKNLEMTMNGIRRLIRDITLAEDIEVSDGRKLKDILQEYEEQMTICFEKAFGGIDVIIQRQGYHKSWSVYLIEFDLNRLPNLSHDKRNGWVVTWSKPIAKIFLKQNFCSVLGISFNIEGEEMSEEVPRDNLKVYYNGDGRQHFGGFIEELLTTENVRYWLPLVDPEQLRVKPHEKSERTISEYLEANPLPAQT